MSGYPHHEQLHIENFTAFSNATFDFVPGVNVFVGENGTGKTHAMKAMYVIQTIWSLGDRNDTTLKEVFQVRNIAEVIRVGSSGSTRVTGSYHGLKWHFGVLPEDASLLGSVIEPNIKSTRPVFIPSIDMMGHTRGFVEAYSEVFLDFDSICRDVVSLMRLERRNGVKPSTGPTKLRGILGGKVESDESGRFYLVEDGSRLAMPLVAEGLRKIATLSQLQDNGWLEPGGTLFWDEPEVNLNPMLMGEVVGAIFQMARRGVQIFLTTHSYVILKELDLQAGQADSIRYFSFDANPNGTAVNPADDLAGLEPNPILRQYESLYDRQLTRATGRNRRGERVPREQH